MNPNSIIPILRSADSGMLYLFPLVSLLFLAVLKYRFPKSIGFIISGFYNPRIFRQIMGENLARTHQVSKLLLINVFIVLLGILGFAYTNILGLSPLYILVIAGVLIVYYSTRVMLNYLTVYLSGMKGLLQESMVYNRFYLGVLGIVLIPGLISLLLLPDSFVFSIGSSTLKFGWLVLIMSLIISYIVKVVVLVLKSVQLKVSPYYIFLYLCTLEILPLVVIIRVLVGEF